MDLSGGGIYMNLSAKVRSGVRIRFSIPVLIAFLLCTLLASAQTNTGRILGIVRDVSGAPVKAATVVISDVQRGTTRTTTSDESGNYVIANLAPGVYHVRIEADRFKKADRSGVELEVAK